MTVTEILEKYKGLEHLFVPTRQELLTLFAAEGLTFRAHERRENEWNRYLEYAKVFAPVVMPWDLPEDDDRGSGRILAAIA